MPDPQEVTAEIPWPSPRVAWYTVTILMLAYTASFLDRTILNLLVGPIRADLHITDTQISLLQGIAFALFYSVMGLPISRLADRASRRIVVACGITVWSIMTAACGLSRSFFQLFLVRIGVAVGEATLSPSAYSMITDNFPPKRRSLAFGVYAAGVSIGQGVALIAGGAAIAIIGQMGTFHLPGYGPLQPWQITFFLVGIPGLLIALFMLTVREPKRRGLLRTGDEPAQQNIPIAQVGRFLLQRWRTYVPIYVGVSLKTLINFGSAAWIPTFFIRVHGWTAPQVGLYYGIILLVFGVSGNLFCGWLAGALKARGRSDANVFLILVGNIILVPFAIAAPLMPSAALAMLLIGFVNFFGTFGAALAPAAIQDITPNQMRAQASAIYLLTINLIGGGLGPTMIAMFTDYVFVNDASVHYSLSAVAALVGPVSVLVVWLGLRRYRIALVEAEQWAEN